MILRLTSFLKINDFGRKYAILDENTRFCGSLLIRKSPILDENSIQNTRFRSRYWGCAPRFARGSVVGPLWVKHPPHYSFLTVATHLRFLSRLPEYVLVTELVLDRGFGCLFEVEFVLALGRLKRTIVFVLLHHSEFGRIACHYYWIARRMNTG